MGVSGCGKTTIGELLSKNLNLPFFDADDFHPELNIQKMSNGQPLDDHDREPWLMLLANKLHEWEKQGGAILSCSALKESYRQILESRVNNIEWIYLQGNYNTINSRMEKRSEHFMKAKMLQSQFSTLEEPFYGLHIDIDSNPNEIVSIILKQLKQNG